ncbi:MAG: hypothetical protein Q7U28_04265 [Aquabacterium sp.]|nr:hypothetical protein [Aquabacterium sp.]
MTTGNSAAMTVSVAGVAPPDLSSTVCQELDAKNKDERKKAIKELKPQADRKSQRAHTQAKGAGMTFSSAKVSVGIGGGSSIQGVATGCSSGKAREALSGSTVKGGTSEMQTGKEKVLCEQANYTHSGGGSGSHGEAKVLNEMSQMAKDAGGSLQGGSVVFNVDWRYSRPDGGVCESGMPCRLCYRMMCAAQKCGIKISLCDASGKPQPFDPDDECDKEKAMDPSDDPYLKLDKRMGEDPLLGRGVL